MITFNKGDKIQCTVKPWGVGRFLTIGQQYIITDVFNDKPHSQLIHIKTLDGTQLVTERDTIIKFMSKRFVKAQLIEIKEELFTL